MKRQPQSRLATYEAQAFTQPAPSKRAQRFGQPPAAPQPTPQRTQPAPAGSAPVQSPMGQFPTLHAYQQHQDAFVQQFLRGQSQYNQGLQAGQRPAQVDVGDAWRQAGENIQSGQYQGNPFQTGNVDAIMGMFGQYGIQAPQGFREQLLQNLGQQSAPPMYPQQPGMYYRHTDGAQMQYPGGPMQPQPAMSSPELTPGMQVPDSWVLRMPQSTRPNVPAGWSVRDLGSGFYSIEAPGQSQADVAAWASQAGASDLSPNRVYGHMGDVAQMPYPGGPSGNFIPKFTDPATGLPYGQSAPPMTYPGGPMTTPPAAQPNPSDPWSYPLRPGHTRGPSGEQIMTREAREAEIRRMEQESGRTYVRPRAGVTNGGWLPPARQNPGASISLSPEQAAGMRQYMESRQASRAQPTPPRTQGTPYRGRRR